MSPKIRDIPGEDERYRNLKSRGVEKVKWITADEDRKYEICSERDGKIYTLDEYMNLDKRDGCMCTIEPVEKKYPVIFFKSDRVPHKVKWITMADERVCSLCGSRHLKIYTFAEFLALYKHFGCRCVVIIVG